MLHCDYIMMNNKKMGTLEGVQLSPTSERNRSKMWVEGVAFAIGLLMVAVPGYLLFVEHVKEAKRLQ